MIAIMKRKFLICWKVKSGEIDMDNKWEESVNSQKDEFELEGIKNWHIYQFEMIPELLEGIHEQLLRRGC